ncbi:hypothetical protein A8144_09540 [Mycobacterium leprae 3125609]|nr:hypothetical protein A8144_09540 [Mycobacterium leprae 3125609]OAX70886.1 hypothetical protein A3216_09235 [Mycobacterium leprae 7935681]
MAAELFHTGARILRFIGLGVVAVMQVAHALASGARTSAMAVWFLCRLAPVPEVARLSAGFLSW